MSSIFFIPQEVYRAPHSFYDPKGATPQKKKQCSQCHTTQSHRWQTATKTKTILGCNCFIIRNRSDQEKNELPINRWTPFSYIPYTFKAKKIADSAKIKRCYICSVTNSSKWRKDKSNNKLVCNACGLSINKKRGKKEIALEESKAKQKKSDARMSLQHILNQDETEDILIETQWIKR